MSCEVILKMREKSVRVNSSDYKLAIRTCSLCENSSKTAMMLWKLLLDEGYVPKVVDYEMLMHCFVKSKSFEEAEKLFEVIRQKGLQPTVWTYNILINGYNKSESWERALQLYQIMKLSGVKPDGITCTMLIDLLLKTNKQQYAHVILKDVQNGDNLVEMISQELSSQFPKHLFGTIDLFDSELFYANFDKVFSEETLQKLNERFIHLYLRKTAMNALLLWFVKQNDRFAVFYLYKMTQRLGKTTPDDLTYKLLLWYCAMQKDTKFFQIIMTNAMQQGVQYNVVDSSSLMNSRRWCERSAATSYSQNSSRRGCS